jgi:hypothetical protein
MVIDDQLNILPISSHMLTIKPAPPNRKVTAAFIQPVDLHVLSTDYTWHCRLMMKVMS